MTCQPTSPRFPFQKVMAESYDLSSEKTVNDPVVSLDVWGGGGAGVRRTVHIYQESFKGQPWKEIHQIYIYIFGLTSMCWVFIQAHLIYWLDCINVYCIYIYRYVCCLYVCHINTHVLTGESFLKGILHMVFPLFISSLQSISEQNHWTMGKTLSFHSTIFTPKKHLRKIEMQHKNRGLLQIFLWGFFRCTSRSFC